MSPRFFASILFAAASLLPLVAADSEYAQLPGKPKPVVQEYSGSASMTTGYFRVRDHWEVRWNAKQVVSVAVMGQDGSIVAGAAGVLRGSLYVPTGGQYYLKVTDGTVPDVVPTPDAASTNASSSGTNAAPVAPTNAAPVSAPAPLSIPDSWHLQVVQLGSGSHTSHSLTVYAPYFSPPDSAIVPAPAPPPPPVLSNEEAATVVRIRGDVASGAGFLLHTPEGNFVVTHLHLLAGNPNLHLFTNAGAEITTLTLKGSTNRDLAMFLVKDQGFTYLSLTDDADNKVQPGEPLIIPDISGQSIPMQGKPGRIISLSPERVDFDNPLRPDSNGVPVIMAKKGTALALVTGVKKSDLSETLAAAWAANPAPGASRIIPYFGQRLTGTQAWELYDPAQFLAETNFLRQVHRDTLCLDSLLNTNSNVEPKFYLNHVKIKSALDTYHQYASGADHNQRIEAAHELLFDLYSITNTDVTTLKGMTGIYAYDQAVAKEELAYRAAIKSELDDFGNDLDQFDLMIRQKLHP